MSNAAVYPTPTRRQPSLGRLMRLADDGLGVATDGCTDGIEPDGTCPHGHVSWLLYLGLI